jgi:hypothetical protein
MRRIAHTLTIACALFIADALPEASLQDAFAQTGTKQVRAKKQKTQRQVPAARATMQPAVPAAQARPPAYDPTMRDGGGGGGGY